MLFLKIISVENDIYILKNFDCGFTSCIMVCELVPSTDDQKSHKPAFKSTHAWRYFQWQGLHGKGHIFLHSLRHGTWHWTNIKSTRPLKENGLEGRMDWIKAGAATQLLSVPVGGVKVFFRGILVTSAYHHLILILKKITGLFTWHVPDLQVKSTWPYSL